jgi:hypothetical protein
MHVHVFTPPIPLSDLARDAALALARCRNAVLPRALRKGAF